MLSPPLPVVEINPIEPPVATVIWLHGLGADGHDFEPIVPQLSLPAELPVRFVFPHAPEIAVTAFGGQRARAWFDFDPTDGPDVAGVAKSVRKVQDLIQQEIDNGLPANRILLAGFSQGGVMALEVALNYTKPLAGILALSTFLVNGERYAPQRPEPNADIEILVTHGLQDEVLPFSLGKSSFETLTGAGYNARWLDYPMGHEVCLQEINDISQWLQQVLG